jgi:D-serine deaminase-like pyridoxal phosphate-dependent protein
MDDPTWYAVENEDQLATPALLVYPDRIQANIAYMVKIAGSGRRLWPHLKTAKMPAVVRMYRQQGVDQFKCATLAEAEMAAREDAAQVLIAFPLLGPHPRRLARLIERYPGTEFLATIDSDEGLNAIAQQMPVTGRPLQVLLDLDVGMHRTGIACGNKAWELYRRLAEIPGLQPGGLHVYDGHIHVSDMAQRRAAVEQAMAPVEELSGQLMSAGLPVPRCICGGSYSFTIHAQYPDRQCSPGTSVFWDYGYSQSIPEQPFRWAAVVATRIVSRSAPNRLCLDLGYKALAAEQPAPRAYFLNGPDLVECDHSEEHRVVEASEAHRYRLGQVLYAVPRHICPTVALYDEGLAVVGGKIIERWPVSARRRELSPA